MLSTPCMADNGNKNCIFFFIMADVDDVPSTDSEPCDVEEACTKLGQMTSLNDEAACDWSTHKCLCRRGFAMVNGECIIGNIPYY